MNETPRQVAIDFVRGCTIALMMVVNNPGTWADVYPPLLHAQWHGCTLTDLVFPFFLFVVGCSMWFSMQKTTQVLDMQALAKIMKRAGLIILIGLLLAKYPFFWKGYDTWRYPGVLQRIGVCYALAAIMVLALPVRGVLVAGAGLLLGYWAILYFHNPTDPYGLETNAVRALDLAFFGPNHIWKGKGLAFDPEGLLSTLPAVATVLMGWWSGRLIGINSQNRMVSVRHLLIAGAACVAVGLAWNTVFPMNKYLWTSSYVLHTGGLAMLLLGASVWVFDVQGWRKWAQFFLIYGSNPLAAYVLAGVIVKTWINIKWAADATQPEKLTNAYQWLYTNSFGALYPGKFGSMLFSFAFCGLIWLFVYAMYRRKLFIKL